MKQKAFTLIELLVVIGIIGILSAIGVVSFGAVREKARRGACIATLRSNFNSDENLVAYWNFDEGAVNPIKDFWGHNGTIVSTVTTFTDGIIDNALNFDGNTGGINILNENFTGFTDFTMSAWIKINGGHKNYDGAIISSGDWNNQHWAFSIRQSNDGIRTRSPFANIMYTFALTKWYQVVFVRSGSTLFFYINGQNIGGSIASSANPLVSNASNTMIGRETYAGGYFAFNGIIDEPIIYNRALSADEIASHYKACKK